MKKTIIKNFFKELFADLSGIPLPMWLLIYLLFVIGLGMIKPAIALILLGIALVLAVLALLVGLVFWILDVWERAKNK